MEYLFGTLRPQYNDEEKRFMRVKGKELIEFKKGQYYVNSVAYTDSVITDSFKIDNLIKTSEDAEGNKYAWYYISDYSQIIDNTPGLKIEIDKNTALLDYISMMDGITTDATVTVQIQSSKAGLTTSTQQATQTQTVSEYFDKVKNYYDRKLWNEYMVKMAVNKWITAAESLQILGGEKV